MKAFLYPNALLARRDHYIAALHFEAETAHRFFAQWLKNFDPETLLFHEHKLLGVASERFPDLVEASAYRGVIQNITRQARLRAHVASAEIERLMSAKEMLGFSVVALGETHQRITSSDAANLHLESLEVALPHYQFDAFVGTMFNLGYQLVRPPKRAFGRAANLAICRSQEFTTLHLRVIGLQQQIEHRTSTAAPGSLCLMSKGGYRDFMQSRRVSLLRRSDQTLFDIFEDHARSPLPLTALPKPANHNFQREIRTILGYSGCQLGHPQCGGR